MISDAIVTKKSQGVLFLVILAPVLIVILSIVIIIVVILVKFRARTPRRYTMMTRLVYVLGTIIIILIICRRKEHDFSPTAVK